MKVYHNNNSFLVPYHTEGDNAWCYLFLKDASGLRLKEVSNRFVSTRNLPLAKGNFKIVAEEAGSVTQIFLRPI
jgi:hypothetical protein